MGRKKLFFGLGIASGGAAMVGSGAFSSMQAERGVSVEVVGDESAFLALEPADGPNGQYATVTDDGLLEVQVSEENDQITGEGLNPRSYYDLGEVFKITNQGTQEVGVWIEHDSEHVTFETDGETLDDGSAPVFVDTGESLPVRILVDTRGRDGDEETLINSMTIHANADPDKEEPEQPAVTATRMIENGELSPGESTTVTVTVGLESEADVDMFERFDPELGAGSFESASVDNTGVSPSFVDLDDGGGIILIGGIGSGSLTVEYSLNVASDAAGGVYSFEPNLVDIDGVAVPIEGVNQIEVVS